MLLMVRHGDCRQVSPGRPVFPAARRRQALRPVSSPGTGELPALLSLIMDRRRQSRHVMARSRDKNPLRRALIASAAA